MAGACCGSFARGTQASIAIADTGTQCALQLTTSTSCQTGDQPSDAEEAQSWLPRARCAGFFCDSTGHLACEEPGQQGGFSQEDSLLEDERTHHEHCTPVCSTGHGRLVCEHTLRLHARKRTGPAKNKAKKRGRITMSSFRCKSCSKHFATNHTLKRHLRSHNGQKPYCCGVCDKRFANKHYLSAHEKTHSGVGPHVCSICNKIFMNKRDWLAHEKKHGSTQCNICKKDFSAITELADHIALRACEKPYSCSLCLKRFSRKDIAVRHEKEHSSDRNYICGTCGRSFIRKHSLFLHDQIHNPSKKPYKCSVCQNGFTRKDFLLRHEKKHKTKCSAFS